MNFRFSGDGHSFDFDIDRMSLFHVTSKTEIQLSRTEMGVLQRLLERDGHVVSDDELLSLLGGEPDAERVRSIIKNLRKKLKGHSEGFNFIDRKRSSGYRLSAEITKTDELTRETPILERDDVKDLLKQNAELIDRVLSANPRLRSIPNAQLESETGLIKKFDFPHPTFNPKGVGLGQTISALRTGQIQNLYHPHSVIIDIHEEGKVWWLRYLDDCLEIEEAHEKLEQINQLAIGGFRDWRLPTLEESWGLMVPKYDRLHDVYLPWEIRFLGWKVWTSDKNMEGRSWGFSYYEGHPRLFLNYGVAFLQPVRSGNT